MRLRENEIISELASQEDSLRPLIVNKINLESSLSRSCGLDGVIEFLIQDGPSFSAAVELLSVSTPKVICEITNRFKRSLPVECKNKKLIPMIIAPYISKKESSLLLEEGISWIDLSGNMIVKIPPNIYIERTGKPNKFPDTSPIKKIYEGISSLVARALLISPNEFSSLSEIVNFINTRNATITIATVSKVLKFLEEELIASRNGVTIKVKKPETLLENLVESYSIYSKRKKDCTFRYDVKDINELISIFNESQVEYAYCGFYAAKIKGLGITDQITIFIKSIQDVKKVFKLNTTIATPDEDYGRVIFIETKKPCVWFNIQDKPLNNIVDDLELYLEMVNDKPRGPKIADQLKGRILGKFNG